MPAFHIADTSDAGSNVRGFAGAPKVFRPQHRPRLNTFDMPELMPSAQPAANPAQRGDFNRRCRQLYQEASCEEQRSRTVIADATGAGATVFDLEVMFPLLDATLIRSICADSSSPAHVIETLLALSGAMCDLSTGGDAKRSARMPPQAPSIGVEDHDMFPALADKDGWQVHSQHVFDRDSHEGPTNAWCDRAKAAAGKPAPRRAVPAPKRVWGTRRKQKDDENDDDPRAKEVPLTEYECRQSVGQRRARNRTQFRRGARSKGSGKGDAGYLEKDADGS